MVKLITTFLVLICSVSNSEAHDFYDAFCCNGNGKNGDCQNIPSKSVKITSKGFEITILPGDHRLATKRHDFILPFSSAKRSKDSEYHLCLFPTEDTLRCFYAPDMGF